MKKLLCIVLTLMIALSFAACAPAAAPAPAAPAPEPAAPAAPAEPAITTVKPNTLILAMSPDYPPYEFVIIGADGSQEFAGFDIEIAKIIAADMGYELEIVSIDFDGLLPAMQAGQADMVLSGMNPTEERLQAVDFSMVYYTADHAMIVRADEASTLTNNDAFAGKAVGAQTGTTQEDIANEMKEALGCEVVSLKQVPTLVQELKTNNVDGVIMEKPVADSYVSQNPDLAVAYTVDNPEGGVAVAVQKNSPALINAINATLERIIADGTVDRLFNEAFTLQEQAAE